MPEPEDTKSEGMSNEDRAEDPMANSNNNASATHSTNGDSSSNAGDSSKRMEENETSDTKSEHSNGESVTSDAQSDKGSAKSIAQSTKPGGQCITSNETGESSCKKQSSKGPRKKVTDSVHKVTLTVTIAKAIPTGENNYVVFYLYVCRLRFGLKNLPYTNC